MWKNSRIQLGFEPKTFRILVRRSYHWATWTPGRRGAEDKLHKQHRQEASAKFQLILTLEMEIHRQESELYISYQYHHKLMQLVIYDSWNTKWKQQKRTLFDSAMYNGLHFLERKMFRWLMVRCSTGSWLWVPVRYPHHTVMHYDPAWQPLDSLRTRLYTMNSGTSWYSSLMILLASLQMGAVELGGWMYTVVVLFWLVQVYDYHV